MKRHELDVFSLVCGLVFAAVAVVYLVAAATDSEVEGRWVIPLALIGLGVAGLVGSVVRARRNGRAYEAVEEPGHTSDATLFAEPSVATSDTSVETRTTEPLGTTGDGPATRSE
ncbi:MAG: hypothetical protein ABWZ26_03490 [Candidatus Nanopelagicales bacterium]